MLARLLLLVASTNTQQDPDTTRFSTVSAGGYFSCALTRQGGAYCWGHGRYGELGTGDTASSKVPVPVRGEYAFVTVTTGRYHACGLTADSAAYCWGANWNGQIGTDSTAESCNHPKEPEKPFACSVRPRAVAGDHHFAAVSAGAVHTCAMTGGGDAHCWGSGPGVLGNEGAPRAVTVPVAVSGGLKFKWVSAGLNHSCGVTIAGVIHCWGLNKDDQLGNDSLDGSKNPVAIGSAVVFAAVMAGGQHTCALTPDSTAYCWGKFENGRLGIGESVFEALKDKKHQTSPAAVEGGHRFRTLSAGGVHTCGIVTSGQAYCWGDNLAGRLGMGGNFLSKKNWSNKPAAVASDLTFTSIGAGDYHTCGVSVDGAVYCWGGNLEGQLGIGTVKGSNKAVRVAF